jgi:hypothetical protein
MTPSKTSSEKNILNMHFYTNQLNITAATPPVRGLLLMDLFVFYFTFECALQLNCIKSAKPYSDALRKAVSS